MPISGYNSSVNTLAPTIDIQYNIDSNGRTSSAILGKISPNSDLHSTHFNHLNARDTMRDIAINRFNSEPIFDNLKRNFQSLKRIRGFFLTYKINCSQIKLIKKARAIFSTPYAKQPPSPLIKNSNFRFTLINMPTSPTVTQ